MRPDQPGPDDQGHWMFTGVGGRSAGYQVLDLAMAITQPLAFVLDAPNSISEPSVLAC